MKLRKLLWIGALMLPLFSCNDPDTSIETEAKLELSIPLNSFNLKSMELLEECSFSGFTTFCLANKDNVQNCPNNILQITPKTGSVLTLPFVEGEISSLSLVWGYGEIGSDDFVMQNSIELLPKESMQNNQDFVINLDEVLEPVIAKIDSNPKTYIKFVVSGNADCQVNSIATIEIPIIVIQEVLNVRIML